ncbi:major facilitator superfamily domain-containing protein [Sporodiniella umbellata]|nr:major facilitator superfamily domain-containing protein [Sporodiniella umbellata]
MYLICKLLYIAVFAVLSAASSYLPIYYHNVLGFSQDQIGLVLAIAPFVQSISCPLWTVVVDKKPKMHGAIMSLTGLLGGVATVSIMLIGHSPDAIFGIEISDTMLVVIVSCLALGFAFFTLPNMALVDSAVMKILGPNKILYGEQRLWGSISAALTILIVGQLISWTGNLDTIFYSFAASTLVFMILALFVHPTRYEALPGAEEEIEPIQRIKTSEKAYNRNYNAIQDQGDSGEESRYVDLFKINSLATVHTVREEANEALEIAGLDLGLAISRIASVDQSLANILEHSAEDIPPTDMFKSPRILTFLSTTLLFGFVLSIIINFLFIFLNGELKMPASWIGWTGPTTGITELLCFCFSKQLQEKFGVTKMIVVAHLAIIVRCIAYTMLVPDSFITNVIALMLQTLHGVGFGIFWATSVSEMDSFFPPEQRSVAQGILGALHFGLGTGLGALVGGYLYQYFGSIWMFRSAALVCTANMFIFCIGRMDRYNY